VFKLGTNRHCTVRACGATRRAVCQRCDQRRPHSDGFDQCWYPRPTLRTVVGTRYHRRTSSANFTCPPNYQFAADDVSDFVVEFSVTVFGQHHGRECLPRFPLLCREVYPYPPVCSHAALELWLLCYLILIPRSVSQSCIDRTGYSGSSR
jgi:hypothetical protein